MIKYTLLLALSAMVNFSIAQKIVKPDIQFVTLTDTFLVRQINLLIQKESKIDTLFAKGFGYITMSYSYHKTFREYKSITDFNENYKPGKDTVFRYNLSSSFMSLDPKENTLGEITPPYYSFVGGRLVFIYDGTGGRYGRYFGFSDKSIKKIKRRLEPFLEKKGSESRRILNLTRHRYIYYLRDILRETMPSERIVVDEGY